MSTLGGGGWAANININGNTAGLQNALGTASGMLHTFAQGFGLGAGMEAFERLFDQVIASIGVFTGYIRDSVLIADDFTRSMVRLDGALMGLGNTTGFAEAELVKMAKVMSSKTEFSVTDIIKAQGELQRAGNITGDTFVKALKLAGDASYAFGRDVAGTAQFVSKALMTPATPTVFKRRRLTGTEEEEKVIRRLVATGRAADFATAQLLRLSIAQEKVGDVSERMVSETVSGMWNNFTAAIGAGQIAVGEKLLPALLQLHPILMQIADSITNVGLSFAEWAKHSLALNASFAAAQDGARSFWGDLANLGSALWDIIKGISDALGFTELWNRVVNAFVPTLDVLVVTLTYLARVIRDILNFDYNSTAWDDYMKDLDSVTKRMQKAENKARDLRKAAGQKPEGPPPIGSNQPELAPGKSITGTFESLEGFYKRLSSEAAKEKTTEDIAQGVAQTAVNTGQQLVQSQNIVDKLAEILIKASDLPNAAKGKNAPPGYIPPSQTMQNAFVS